MLPDPVAAVPGVMLPKFSALSGAEREDGRDVGRGGDRPGDRLGLGGGGKGEHAQRSDETERAIHGRLLSGGRQEG